MVQKLKPTAWALLALLCATGLATISWQSYPVRSAKHRQQDTLPKQRQQKEDKTIINGDIDKAIDEVNKATENLDAQLEGRDWEKMNHDLQKSFEGINAEKIQEQLSKALKEIDAQKIQVQVQESLRKIDWEKMQRDIQKMNASLQKNPGFAGMQKDVERAMEETKKAMASLKSVDMEKIQFDLDKLKEEIKMNQGKWKDEMENARKSLQENFHKDMKQELEKAKEGVHRAAEELKNYKDMLTEMDKDGLLNANGPYKIEYKKGALIINGKTQPDNVTDKYKHYFKKENVTIKKGKDGEDDRTIDL